MTDRAAEKPRSSPAPRAASAAPPRWRSPRAARRYSSTMPAAPGKPMPSPPKFAKPAAGPKRSAPICQQPEGPQGWPAGSRQVVGDRLDILVANAGVAKPPAIEETTDRGFRRAVRGQCPRAVSSWCSNCCRSCRRAAASCSLSSLAAHAAVGACRPMPRPRARSTRWSGTLRPILGGARHSRQRRRAGRGRDRHVVLRQDRRRTRIHARACRR